MGGNTNKQTGRALGERAHHQNPLTEGDGENAGSNIGGACISRRAGRRYLGNWTDGLIAPPSPAAARITASSPRDSARHQLLAYHARG